MPITTNPTTTTTTTTTTTKNATISSPSSSLFKTSPLAEGMLDATKHFLQRAKELGQRKVVRHEDTHHVFEEFLVPKSPTVCSQCSDMILITQKAKSCKDCKLVGHERCLATLRFKCTKNTNCQPAKHQFELHFFKKFTYCKHCGLLLWGVLHKQGLRCKKNGCGIDIHAECEQYICRPCRQIEETKSPARVSMKDFDLIDELGSGSFSSVYLARMRGNGKKFALKVVKKSNPNISCDPQSVLTEIRVLQLGRYHPFLTSVYCCFQTERRLYFLMEYVDGESLYTIILHSSKPGKLTEDQTRYYSAEIAIAVKFLHDKGVVHRDLKLENVIIGRDGHCKLTDFGMSKFLDQSEDMKTRTFCGTPHYMSPEMIHGLAYGFSCDWWALGVLMFELLLGYPPFCTPDSYDEEGIYQMIKDVDVDVPDHLTRDARSILQGLLTKDPERRLSWPNLQLHPFFLFENRYGSREHQWDALSDRQIKPPSMPIIKKGQNRNYKPPQELIDDVITKFNPSGLFSEFNYCDHSFESLLLQQQNISPNGES